MKPTLGNKATPTAFDVARACESRAEHAVAATRTAFREASAAWDGIRDVVNRLETSPGEIAVKVRDADDADAVRAALRDAPTRAFVGIVGRVVGLSPHERQWVLTDVAARLRAEG